MILEKIILILGIILITLSLYFFIIPPLLRLKKIDEEKIKNKWPRNSYATHQILDEPADYKKFTAYINTYIGDLNKTSIIMNIVSGIVTLISGIVLLISI